MRRTGFLSLLILFYTAKAFSIGTDIVYDPLNVAQATISATNSGIQLLNQGTQITQQLTQIKYALQNLLNYDGNQTQWSDAQQLLEKLAHTVSQGHALSYNAKDMNQAFALKFPGYQAQRQYDQAYQDWSATVMDTLRNTLTSAGMQADAFSSEQAILNQLKQSSINAKGRMQAVQVGNMIASEQIGQMRQLRQLLMSQTNAQNAYMAYRVQQDQAKASAESNLFAHPIDYPKYGTGKGFGASDLAMISH